MMSEVSIEDIYELATFFMKLSSQQRIDFLRHTTKEQCEIIRQANYNILLNSSIDLDTANRQYLNRNIGAIKKLASTKVCNKDKQHILPKKHNVIARIFKIIIKYFDTRALKEQSEIEAETIE